MQGDAGSVAEGSGGRSRRRRGREKDPAVDEAVLTAAVDLLAETGFARLTMEQVAARAKVSKASVYLRWPNKVALVAEAIRHRSGVVPDIPDTGSLRGDMLVFLRALMLGRPSAQRAVSAVTGETATNPELREAWRRGVTGTLTACVRAIVERAVGRGELPPDTNVELLSLLPLAIMQHWSLVHGQPPGEKLAGQIVDQFYTSGGAGHPPSAPGRKGQR